MASHATPHSPSAPVSLEPIALVGIGLRLPGGAHDVPSFWKLMCDRTDAVTEIPADRWDISRFYDPVPNLAGKTPSKWGGFIPDVFHFDPLFFGLSPSEAEAMDPQQRLLLEASWHALEDAGVPISRADRAPLGVFVGVSTNDHLVMHASPTDYQSASPFAATGSASSIASNRISHLLNLKGPSISVDTACSSSLIALHLACQSIWSGESPAALAGGVNTIANPLIWLSFSYMSALSHVGRCQTYDAKADGFVRAEGAGMVLLKPLSRALADGDRIYACIRATGANQDGYTPAIAMPDREAQEALIEETCRRARIHPGQVHYVEAHGTGTAVGDPIEANAIGNTFGRGRPRGNALLVGSVKTNLGHLESAAGVAGLIKTALVLYHRRVPPNLHFETPNPAIDFEHLQLKVPVDMETLGSSPEEPLYAAVNSFGFGGSNAHALLESPPPASARSAPTARHPASSDHASPLVPRLLLPLSAQSESSLQSLAAAVREKFPADPSALAGLCAASARRRTHHRLRSLCTGNDPASLLQAVDALAAGESHAALQTGMVLPKHSGLVFVFSGQGCQFARMGRTLFQESALFRAHIEKSHECIRSLGGFSLIDELNRETSESRLNRTEIAQPAIFSMQAALAHFWMELGIRPAAVIGHSVGEVAAAHVAGCLTHEEAIRVIYHRGRTMGAAPGGKMLALGISAAQGLEAIAPYGNRLALAAVNGPSSITLSGEAGALAELVPGFESQGVFCRYVPVEYAFHSAQMDPVRKDLLESLKGLTSQKPKLPVYSSVTGKLVTEADFGAEYWWQNVRQTVQFAPAATALAQEGHVLFLEIGGHPVLASSIAQCVQDSGAPESLVLPTLRRDADDWQVVTTSLGRLYCAGISPDWNRLLPQTPDATRLPLYPWDRQPFRSMGPTWKQHTQTPVIHPFLASQVNGHQHAFQFWPDRKHFPFLNDHVIGNRLIFPGSGYLDAALALARHLHPGKTVVLEDIEIQRALVLPDQSDPPVIRTTFDPATASFEIHSSTDTSQQSWTRHVVGSYRPSLPGKTLPAGMDGCRDRCPDEVSPAWLYAALREFNVHHGPLFHAVQSAWHGEMESWGTIELPEALADKADKFCFHPVLLDAAFQLVPVAFPRDRAKDVIGPLIPVGIDRLRLHQPAQGKLQVQVRITHFSPTKIISNIWVTSESGEPVADISGFTIQSLDVQSQASAPAVRFLQETWEAVDLPGTPIDPVPPSDFLPDAARLAAPVQSTLDLFFKESGLDTRSRQLKELDTALTLAFIGNALLSLGLPSRKGALWTLDLFSSQANIPPARHAYLSRLLTCLEKDGKLQKTGTSSWKLLADLAVCDTSPLIQRWTATLPGAQIELELILLCGGALPDLLTGTKSLHDLVDCKEHGHLLERYFRTSLLFRPGRLALEETLAQIASHLPAARCLRVLELDAGNGAGTLAHLPDALPHARLLHAGMNDAALAAAKEVSLPHPRIEFCKLDLSQDPGSQGLSADYDLVIAFHALHMAPDTAQALTHLRRLIRPGGYLLLGEIDRPPQSLELIFGTLSGWEAIPNYPPLSQEAWRAQLTQAGFAPAQPLTTGKDAPIHSLTLFCCQQTETPAAAAPATPPAPPAVEAAATLPPLQLPPGRWLILADQGGVAARLAEELEKIGHQTTRVPSKDFKGTFASLFAHPSGLPLHGIFYAGALDLAHNPDLPPEDLRKSLLYSAHLPLELAQAVCTAFPGGSAPALWFLTRGALAPLDGDIPDPTQIPLHGLGRVLQSEVRELTVRCVDADWSGTEIASLVRECNFPAREDQIAYRGSTRFVPRYRYAEPSCQRQTPPAPLSEQPARLTSRQFGVLDHLHLESLDPTAPAAGEVEVEVRATGLNFRDVMKALKIYPSDAPDFRLLGDEFSGVIRRVGPSATRFQTGDRVTGVWAGAFTSRITLGEKLLCPLPDHLSFEEGCTLFTASLTAHYALHEIARIKPGERVLIHSAAGGVGLAAVHMAAAAGAEVFATAGSTSKRDLLRSLGVKYTYDSRTLEFAEEIMRDTRGEGIDIVLNSLAGEAIPKSLSCLRIGGRFIEIGKRDIYANTRLGLRPFKNGLLFCSVDLARMISPEGLPPTIERVSRMVQDGTFRPLPYRTFSFARPASAFHFMAQGRHVGKIILSLQNERAHAEPAVIETPPQFPSDATFLVTGGVRGFGLATARWLADHGVRHLVLVSRTGKGDAETEEALKAFAQEGVTATLHATDITDAGQTRQLLEQVRKTRPPIAGIFHAAVAYADDMALRMTREKFDECALPKMLGAWNLHQLTAQDPLRWFVLYSSISTVIANPGQSNYVAANLFLDSLALARRRRGLPATVIAWDRIRDTGQVARNKELGDYLDRLGCPGLTNEDAFFGFGRALSNDAIRLALSNVQFSVWAKSAGPNAQLGRFSHLMGDQGDGEEEEQSQRIRQDIFAAAPEDRLALVETFLTEQIARVLRIPPKRVSRTMPLNQQGLDSLMAVELLSLIEGRLAISIPTTNMMDAPTIPKLSVFLLELVTGEKSSAGTAPIAPTAPAAPAEAAKAPPLKAPAKTAPSTPAYPVFPEDATIEEDLSNLQAWVRALPWKATAPQPTAPPQSVFLTGASGFIGSYVAAALLEHTQAEVHCLVRAANPEAAKRRLEETFHKFDLHRRVTPHLSRLHVVAGDAARPAFGLAESEFQQLASSCDAMVHFGAAVHHIASYRQIRDDNVIATLNTLRFAAVGRPMSYFFASSVTVFNSETEKGQAARFEDDPHDPLESLTTGYGRTKAVCEELIASASGCGLAVTNLRMPPVTGDGVAGMAGGHDIIWRTVKACLSFGLALRNDQNIYLTPVDFIAPVVAHIVRDGTTRGTYHVATEHPVSFDAIFDQARKMGYKLRRLSPGPWLKAARAVKKVHALTPYFVLAEEHVQRAMQLEALPVINTLRCQELLEKYGLKDIPVDAERIQLYFRKLIASGFLPPPESKPDRSFSSLQG
jgi:thioester reductase-like protein